MKKKKTSKAEPMLGTQQQRFELLLEDMHSDIKLIAEQSTLHTERFDKVDNRFDGIDKRLDGMEANIAIIKIDLEFIKNELKQKVNRDEFVVIEKRLSMLENKFAAAL